MEWLNRTDATATLSVAQPVTVKAAFAEPVFNKQQSNRIYRYISNQMRAMSPDDFVEMLRSAIKQDEWLLFVHGGVLGLFAGFLHLAIFGV